MFNETLTIQNPFGITVFGSALLRVSPDCAFISAAVSRLEEKPSDSVVKAQEGARRVAVYLGTSKVEEFGTSRISLTREIGGKQEFKGHRAVVGFTVKVAQLERLESLIAGLVEAGANEINSVRFQTSQLKDFRSRARALAIKAAREKAAVYSEAAGVSVGKIIHIQDLNPIQATAFGQSQFHVREQLPSDIEESASGNHGLDPSAIEVAAAVLVAFKLD